MDKQGTMLSDKDLVDTDQQQEHLADNLIDQRPL